MRIPPPSQRRTLNTLFVNKFLLIYLDFSTRLLINNYQLTIVHTTTILLLFTVHFSLFTIFFMEYIQALLRRYPNRIKYGILILDIFAMIIAIRTYVNYVSIETAIEEATIQQQVKTEELAFTQNFLVNYEKSEYAKYFLEHENNMLLGDEFIIKFEEMYQKQQANT